MTTEQQWKIEQLLDALNASAEAGDFVSAAAGAREFAELVEQATKEETDTEGI